MAIVAMGILVAIAYSQTYHMYRSLSGVTPALTSARAKLAQGQLPTNDEIATASGMAGEAQEQIDRAGFAFRFTASLPILGRPIHAIERATDAADQESQAAAIVQGLVTKMFGIGGTGPPPVFNHGVIDVGLIANIAPDLDRLVANFRAAQADLEAIPHLPFVSQVDSLKARALSENSAALALAQRALSGARLLPSFLGADGPRNYFVPLLNNNDQRGSGGAMLAYALLNIDGGRISLVRAGSINDIDDHVHGFPTRLAAADLWYAQAAGVVHRMANINFSPDFPAAAETWVPMVKLATGVTVNGVIALDPYAVAAALAHQRPIPLPAAIRPPQYGATLDGTNLVPFTEHDQYLLPKVQQLLVPGLLIKAAYDAITNPKDFLPMVQSLTAAMSQKHVQMWSADPAQQGLIHSLGWDGALHNAAGGDYLDLAYEKRIGGKQDYYLQEDVQYSVDVNASGGITSTYQLTARNVMPPGQPPSISGRVTPYGVIVGMWNLYVPGRAHIISWTPVGEFPQDVVTPDKFTKYTQPKEYTQHTEGGFRVLTNTGLTWPGNPYGLSYRYTVPRVIKDTPEGKVYTLTVQNQPFINPMALTVRVTLPKGATVTAAGPGWTFNGNVGTFIPPASVVTKDFTTSITFH